MIKAINGRKMPFTDFSQSTQDLIKSLIEKHAPEFYAEMRKNPEMVLYRYKDFWYIHASLASNITEEEFLENQKAYLWEAMAYLSRCDAYNEDKFRWEAEVEARYASGDE